MASKYPRSYGGDKSKEHQKTDPKIHSQVQKQQPHQQQRGIKVLSTKQRDMASLDSDLSQSNKGLFRSTIGYTSNKIYGKQDGGAVDERIYESAALTRTPKVNTERITMEKSIFDVVQPSFAIDKGRLVFNAVKYTWKENHLKLEQGLNLLAICKKEDCDHYLQSVVCPRGMFLARKGYCPLDMEIHKVKCPTCKQKIVPDESFGFGFYNCSFQLTYQFENQPEYHMEQEGREGVFYYRKLCPIQHQYEHLEVVVSTHTCV